MSSPFLSGGGGQTVQEVLTSGQQSVNFSTIISQNLIPGLPVASNNDKELISRQIAAGDLNFSVLINPYIGTLEATDFKTGSYASFNSALNGLTDKTVNFTATVGDTDFGNTTLSDINIITSNIQTTGRTNFIQQASMGTPAAGRNILWSLTTDKRLYTTDELGTTERIAYTSDAPGGGGDTITNGAGESVIVNANGSISYIGGGIESIITASGSPSTLAAAEQKNIIVDNITITNVTLPVSPTGTIFYVRREYASQIGDAWPVSVLNITATASTIEGLASLPLAPFSGVRLIFIGTKWVTF